MPELEPQAAPQAAGSKVSQTIARLKALAQRIPWWGWLLIVGGIVIFACAALVIALAALGFRSARCDTCV
jgi:uncharacterized membrane protein